MSALPCDYHIHLPFCGHASHGIEDYVTAARTLGIPEIAFTDHAPAPDGYDAANRMRLSGVPSYQALVGMYQYGSAPNVILGIEADYYEGGTEFLRGWLPSQPFDIVLGSVHYINNWPFDHPGQVAAWSSVDVRSVWHTYFGLVAKLADTRLFDVVAHLDLPKKFGHFLNERDLVAFAAPALDRVAAAGMAIEINTSGLRRQCREPYPSAALLELARTRGIAITFGSDAHTPSDVGSGFEQAVALARHAGYTHYSRFFGRRQTPTPLPD
jgi:histidinol-phosphatase (PHP family)